MIDRSFIGHVFDPFTVEVEKGRIRFFARTIGETNPVFTDEEAARAAGYASLPLPPTQLFCLEMDGPDPFLFFNRLGLDFARLLHGEQSFAYQRVVCAGERLTFTQTVADIYDKKNSALEFVLRETAVDDEAGRRVADLKSTLVIRNG
ncbi:MaoC family dehydratase N-terminal domain-containing protein [Xanthobacter versatilis]|uniref:MaoC family dehydratase N-terminal domain-containing protein n=1 Tax=Xanthobacter autotrophicus (strain ATCC BAA-1158 / Py2) TaxID=78245 RepID=UPI0037265024